jgi:hypothetical protein
VEEGLRVDAKAGGSWSASDLLVAGLTCVFSSSSFFSSSLLSVFAFAFCPPFACFSTCSVSLSTSTFSSYLKYANTAATVLGFHCTYRVLKSKSIVLDTPR